MKLGAQLGKLNSLPACTSEVAGDSVTAADQGKNWSPAPPPMAIGADQVAPPLAERMYTTSASVPFQLDHTTCSVDPSSASAGKLSSRHVAPGSGLGMSLIGAMSLVLKVVPPLWETAKATASPLLVVASKVTYTVPSLPTTTVALMSVVNTFETLLGTDQVRPPSVVLEMTIAELRFLSKFQAT